MANSILGIINNASSQKADATKTSGAGKTLAQNALQADEQPPLSQIHDAPELSDLGALVATVAKRAGTQGSIRSDLVASLRAQISAGTYNPDPDEVAASVAAAMRS